MRCNVDVAAVLRGLFTLPTWATLADYRKKIRANPDLISNKDIIKHVVQVMKYDHRFYRKMNGQRRTKIKLDSPVDADNESVRYSVSEILCRFASKRERDSQSGPDVFNWKQSCA